MLFNGLTPGEAKQKPHYRASFNRRGLVKTVTFVDFRGKDQWTYHVRWDKEGYRSSYSIEFHLRQPLTELHPYFFVPDVSEVRPGWRAECSFFPDGKIKSMKVTDGNGYVFYTYRFDIRSQPSGGMTVHSRYYRKDSTLVGSHQLHYDSDGLLKTVRYFDQNQEDIRTLRYLYKDDLSEVVLSVYLPDKILQERRIISFSEDLREVLAVDEEQTGLSDVVRFMESTSQEDIEKLAGLIEQKYRVNVDHVDTTYSPITRISITDTVVIKQTDTLEVIKKKRYLDYRLGFGTSYLSGKSFGNQTILHGQVELGLSRPYAFFFIKHINPILTLSVLRFDQELHPLISGGFYQQVSIPLALPFTSLRTSIPVQLFEQAGATPNEWCFSAGMAFPFTLKLPMKVGFRGMILIQNDLNQETGFLDITYSVGLHPLFRKK